MLLTELLTNARTTLLDRGWIQGHYRDEEGACCLDGALLFACTTLNDKLEFRPPDHIYWEAKQLVAEIINAGLTPEDFGFLWHIPSYNDKLNTTLENVIDVLDTAIEIAEVEEELV